MVEELVTIIGSISINPLEVEYTLGQAGFWYPRNNDTAQLEGWSKTAVIPALYNLTAHLQRFPQAREGVAFVLGIADEGVNTESDKIQNRARKLYMDFCREMHTMGLLQRCDLLGYVQYQKSLDIRFNVDFLASLCSMLGGDRIAVQSAMRAFWPDGGVDEDYWNQIKSRRRRRRRENDGESVKEWEGDIFWLTNRTRSPEKKISGCWLFGPDHINDLAEEIRDSRPENEHIAVQMEML